MMGTQDGFYAHEECGIELFFYQDDYSLHSYNIIRDSFSLTAYPGHTYLSENNQIYYSLEFIDLKEISVKEINKVMKILKLSRNFK